MVAVVRIFLWTVFVTSSFIGVVVITGVINKELPFGALIMYLVLMLVASLAIKVDYAMKPKEWLKCDFCGYYGRTIVIKKGSPTLEMLLWVLFLPGAYYANWRNKRSYYVCQECGSTIRHPK